MRNHDSELKVNTALPDIRELDVEVVPDDALSNALHRIKDRVKAQSIHSNHFTKHSSYSRHSKGGWL